ncbi:hypothetical protein J7E97_31975, partial [Streptomyces sp. ISL-66]|nr:hypothetical protein [Streptomyces sp. ISL-66]
MSEIDNGVDPRTTPADRADRAGGADRARRAGGTDRTDRTEHLARSDRAPSGGATQGPVRPTRRGMLRAGAGASAAALL